MSDRRGASASSATKHHAHCTSTSRLAGEAADLTWLEFLRTAGGTAPDHRSTSADRKRRYTGTEPERRDYPYPAFISSGDLGRRISGTSEQGPRAGVSRETALDLTSSPRLRPIMAGRPSDGSRRGGLQASNATRRASDIVPPKWQPDSEVSKCPVCHAEFSFWFRKHHCRKCGRIVCAACSPHRITIPRQYIVQPPNPFEQEFGITEVENPMARYLGGGEVVRVCNPCVPDPWTPNPNSRAAEGGDMPAGLLAESERRPDVSVGDRPERYRLIGQSTASSGRNRAHSHQPSVPPFSRSIPGQGIPGAVPPFHPPQRGIAPVPPPPPGRPSGHRHSQSTNSSIPTMVGMSGRRSIVAAPSAPPPPLPKREVREEDECPVCGMELPPGERIREAHIQECIATRFSCSTPSNADPFQPPPSTNLDSASGSTPPPNRPRATSYRPRGMALYRATEKDCLTEDGSPQECVICFEEFQPGDEMGRMECLCKFHRQCIRQWWDTKGAGSCPTHQLHE